MNKVLLVFFTIVITFFSVSTGLYGKDNTDGIKDLKVMTFKETNALLTKANQLQGEFFSPENYEKGIKYYRSAEAYFQDGSSPKKYKSKLTKARKYFNIVLKNVAAAKLIFKDVLQAKEDAKTAGADKSRLKLWEMAEEKFEDAISELEDGDLEDARSEAGKAEKHYREAELKAIKNIYLNNARKLVAEANDLSVEDNAPKSLKLAINLLKKAEKELDKNRYDTKTGKKIALQAEYEARHAIFLHKTIKKLKEKDKEFEDLLLAAEESLKQVAVPLKTVLEFDKGMTAPVEIMVKSIELGKDSLQQIKINIAEMKQKIQEIETLNSELNAKNLELNKQLKVFAEKEASLKEKIEARNKILNKFASIEKLFPPQFAKVIRTEGKIILRLTGLKFKAGKADIGLENLDLLKRVQKAITTFDSCSVIIEGHTDSHGSDKLNLQISDERAKNVKLFLASNVDLEKIRMVAVGFGEEKPVANNETKEGREQNRRIDVIIDPGIVEY